MNRYYHTPADEQYLMKNPMPPNPKEWYTIKQAAEYLSLAPITIRRAIAKGQLAYAQRLPGHKILIRYHWLIEYLSNRRSSGRS